MIWDHLSFEPPLGWWPVIALAVLALLVVAVSLARRASGSLGRIVLFLVLLAGLAGPHFLSETTRPLPDIALLLVDHSQSMQLGNRLSLAAQAEASLAASAGPVEVHVVDVPPAEDHGTALFSALRGALATIPPAQLAGVAAITDGEISDTPGSLNLPAPFTTLLAAKAPETDRELRLLETPAYGLVGQTAALKLEVLDHGVDDAGQTAAVDVTANGTPLVSQQVQIGQPVTIGIPVSHAGPTLIAASVAALPGEVSRINNQAAFTLNGIHKQLNILLISGSPDQGERSWRLLLKSDPAVQLVHFTILRTPNETVDADPKELALVPFPVRQLFETDIGKFDLIIIDQFNTVGLLPPAYLANIARYVQNGGALLAELGPEFPTMDSLAFSPLGAVLPATPADPGTITQPFTPVLTPLGLRHPVTAPLAGIKLPPWFRMETASPNSGNVLMQGPGGALLLILGAAGQGRVGMLLSDQLWLWTRGGAHQGPALPLLRRIVHWLLREPALEAESLNATLRDGTLTIDRQTLAAANPGDASITAPDGHTSKLALKAASPGHYAASMAADQQGVWKISEGGLTAYAALSLANAEEYQDLAATSTILQPVSNRVLWLGQTPHPTWPSLLTPRHASAITGTRDVPLLPPLPMAAIVLALLFATWWRESR